jgi:hypothetical protein
VASILLCRILQHTNLKTVVNSFDVMIEACNNALYALDTTRIAKKQRAGIDNVQQSPSSPICHAPSSLRLKLHSYLQELLTLTHFLA